MTRIRNILQQRANRYRTKQGQEQSVPLSFANDNMSGFTEQLVIKPRMESDAKYSLEAATATETFSSEEENTAYSNEHTSFQDGGEFLDLAYEASRQGKNGFGEHEFIDLVQESGNEESNYRSFDDCKDEFESKQFAQPDTIEFVDSEDGQVFNISQEKATGHADILQNVRSLDDSNTLENDECSKTLNTNHETLQSLPSLNEDDIAEMKMSNRMNNLHVDIRDNAEEEFEEYELEECDLEEPAVYEHGDYHGVQSPAQGASQLYDCDDGEMYYDDQGNEYSGEAVPMQGYEEDGNFFDQLRNVQARHVVEEEVQAENWQSVKNQVHYENPQIHANPQLEDPYISDGNDSWEEGSFATGASRNVSRVDSVDDDHTYETFDGADYYSDEDSEAERNQRPIVRMLKKIRHDISKDDDDQSRGESSDEEGNYNGKKKRSKDKRRRRKQHQTGTGAWIIDSLREIGTDAVDEAIEFVESQDRSSRRGGGRSQTDTMIDSFANLFSCGGIN